MLRRVSPLGVGGWVAGGEVGDVLGVDAEVEDGDVVV